MSLSYSFFTPETDKKGLQLLIETIGQYFDKQQEQHTNINHKTTINDAKEYLKTYSSQLLAIDSKDENNLCLLKNKITNLYERIEKLADHLPSYQKELNLKRA